MALFLHGITPLTKIRTKTGSASARLKILGSLWNPKVHYRVRKDLPLDFILSQINSDDSLFFKTHLHISLYLAPGSQVVYFLHIS
jgi:hypothetical protein